MSVSVSSAKIWFWFYVCVCVSGPLRDVLSASVGPVSESQLEICSVKGYLRGAGLGGAAICETKRICMFVSAETNVRVICVEGNERACLCRCGVRVCHCI